MKKARLVSILLFALGTAALSAESLPAGGPVLRGLETAGAGVLDSLGIERGSENLLVLTNAGYGEVDGKSTEAALDALSETFGVSPGRKNLLAVHSSRLKPLWFAAYAKNRNKLVYAAWRQGGFRLQTVDAAPEVLLKPEGWKKALAGIIGSDLFGVTGLSLAWAQGTDWPLLLAACYHNHFCPGLNSGYIAAEYVRRNFPLAPGETYVFVGAPAMCAMDAVQILFDATLGKGGSYGYPYDEKNAAEYFGKTNRPLLTVMKVDGKKNTCKGLVLSLAWDRIYSDLGVGKDEMSPPGGSSNPLFHISRVKLSRGLAGMPMEKQLAYIVKVKEFAGPAALAKEAALGGADPYAVIWK